MVKTAEKVTETVEVTKDLGVKLYKVQKVREQDDKGNEIKCPTLAYVHLIVPTAFGDMVVGEHRVLRGKDGNPFVVRPSRSRQLFDAAGNPASVQRFNTMRIEGAADAEFDKTLKEKVLVAYGK